MRVSECQWYSNYELTEPTGEKAASGLYEAVRKVTYINLLTSGKLNAYLPDINGQAQERSRRLIEGMKQAQGNGMVKRRKRLRMDRANPKV